MPPITHTPGPTPRRKVRRRRMTRGARPGTARGMDVASPHPGSGNNIVNYEELSTGVRCFVEGFALGRNITSQQAITGLKKHLVW